MGKITGGSSLELGRGNYGRARFPFGAYMACLLDSHLEKASQYFIWKLMWISGRE